jgi:alcohol dehydrogenase class IV
LNLINGFQFYRTPQIIFGLDKSNNLGQLALKFGKTALIIHGKYSLGTDNKWDKIEKSLNDSGISILRAEISGEPSPQQIDSIVEENRSKKIDVVIGIGGGSVIDAGKAVSAMLPVNGSVEEYLEVAGDKTHPGTKIPYIATPTTSGTGSEASANAVISSIGKSGFKRSLRHTNFVPDIALVDPRLTMGCPKNITSACGMDALTQLLESYVSIKASPFTDALVENAFPHIRNSLIKLVTEPNDDIHARSSLAYSALISGITLANSGLGVVHGIASSLGAFFTIPHGVVCGTLLATATEITIQKLKQTDTSSPSLKKYADAGKFLSENSDNISQYCTDLIQLLYHWTDLLEIPRLSEFGIKKPDLRKIADKSGNKNNPVKLSKDEIEELLEKRL